MADTDIILDVSNTLIGLINDAAKDLFPGQTVAALHDLSDPNAALPLLSVFLFEVMEDAGSRNLPTVRQPQKDSVLIKKAPMALQLNYLFTPWTKNFATDQKLLGRVLQLFYDGPILGGAQLQGGLAGSADSLKVTLHPMTLEDRTRVWHALQRPYRVSLGYGVRVVYLDVKATRIAAAVTSGQLESSKNGGALP